MEFVHSIIGFIKTIILILLGIVIGFVLGAMTHPYAQAFGIGNILQMMSEGGFGNMIGQGVITNAAVGGVIGGLIGWGIAWLTRRKKPAPPAA